MEKLKAGLVESTSAPTSPNVGCLDLTWDEDEARSVKRKREDEVTSGERLARALRKTFKEVDGEVRKLSERAKERNTKKEIKEIAAKLRSLMSLALTDQNWELLQTMGRRTQERNMEECEQRGHRSHTVTMGTQTEDYLYTAQKPVIGPLLWSSRTRTSWG